MIPTKLEDLKKDKFYLLYDNSDNTKTLLIFNTTSDLVDIWKDDDPEAHFDNTRWEIEGASYAEFYRVFTDDKVLLDVTDPDTYADGFEFQDNDSATFWELTDSELAVHTINHL